jgi:hypothetical protein
MKLVILDLDKFGSPTSRVTRFRRSCRLRYAPSTVPKSDHTFPDRPMGTVRLVTVGGRRMLIDEWHQIQDAALRRLAEVHDRPIFRAELAADLGVDEDLITNAALVRRGYALVRIVRDVDGVRRRTLAPRPRTATRLHAALRALERMPDGHSLTWKEPRRHRGRRGRPFIERSLTATATRKSRVRSGLKVALQRLGLRGLRRVQEHHLPMILAAVHQHHMEASLIPAEAWGARSVAARRARRTAGKRRSEMLNFLSLAEHLGLASLSRLEAEALSPEWVLWCGLAGGEPGITTDARRIAVIASRIGADSPDRLVAIGFERFEAEVHLADSITSARSARTTLTRLRRAWDRLAGMRGLPAWPRTVHPWLQKDERGGLRESWWSGKAFFLGRRCLLDEPHMAHQRAQAADLRDWLTLEDPTRRPIRSDQGSRPLPPRPERSRNGRRRLGARRAAERTAIPHLCRVSRFLRFCLSHALEPIPEDQLATKDWAELYGDRRLVLDYIDWEFDREISRHGRLFAGISRIWTTYTLLWAYFPAAEEAVIRDGETRLAHIDLNDTAGEAEAASIQRQLLQARQRIVRWQRLADEVRAHILRRTTAAGGIAARKDRSVIRRHLSHRTVLRIADWYRDCRLERLAELRRQTDRRTRAASPTGRSAPGECGHPGSGSDGLLLDRTACLMANRELILRLLAIIPWRPSVFRRALIGRHIDPETLAFTVIGHDGKVERNPDGSVRRQEATVGDLDYVDDPLEVERLVEVLRLVLDDVQPWLWAHPTPDGRRRRETTPGSEDWSRRLLLTSRGIPWDTAGSFSAAFATALEVAAKEINRTLQDGEQPIVLPHGYGARGSYVLRFLWGHRAIERGASYGDVARVLGNSERTVRKAYHDVQPTEALNGVIRKIRAGGGEGLTDPTPTALEADLDRERRRNAELERELEELRGARRRLAS